VWKSLRNLPHVHVLSTGELNAYDVLVSDWVVFTPDSLPGAQAKDDAEAAATEPAATPDETGETDETGEDES
jgi:large subunit ribosomal protein L4